jgi:predicted metal-binding protein
MPAAVLQILKEQALARGASAAAVIAADDIVVDDELARRCGDPRCPHYGLSASCPPHVGGPPVFRSLQKRCAHALVVRIDLPTGVLLSEQMHEVSRFLYELVAALEREALAAGCAEAAGFAGGSCKQAFCSQHPSCRKTSLEGICRHPDSARGSMSGHGINVGALMKSCGWQHRITAGDQRVEREATSWLAGLVMIGGSDCANR